MDEYDWQKNQAIVLRLYYTERTWETTCFFAGLYTMVNYTFMRRNYFKNLARTRIAPCWAYAMGINFITTFVMVKPLDWKEEVVPQVRKRVGMGKWICSTYHLDEDIKYTDWRLV